MLRRARELWRQKIGERTKYIDMNELIKLRQVSHKSKDAKERRIMKEAQFKQVFEIRFFFFFGGTSSLAQATPQSEQIVWDNLKEVGNFSKQ